MQYAAPSLQADKAFLVKAVEVSLTLRCEGETCALKFAAAECKQDQNLALQVAAIDPTALNYVDLGVRTTILTEGRIVDDAQVNVNVQRYAHARVRPMAIQVSQVCRVSDAQILVKVNTLGGGAFEIPVAVDLATAQCSTATLRPVLAQKFDRHPAGFNFVLPSGQLCTWGSEGTL